MFESSSKNSFISKQAFEKAVEMAKVIKNNKNKTPQNNKELIKEITKFQQDNKDIKDLSIKVDYSTELSRILNDMSRTMGESQLSEAQSFTIKTFLSTIKGLKKAGSTTSAYIVAKNAMIFLMGTLYTSDAKSQHIIDFKNIEQRINAGSGVKIDLSEKARLFKPFYNNHIKIAPQEPQNQIKGSHINRAI